MRVLPSSAPRECGAGVHRTGERWGAVDTTSTSPTERDERQRCPIMNGAALLFTSRTGCRGNDRRGDRDRLAADRDGTRVHRHHLPSVPGWPAAFRGTTAIAARMLGDAGGSSAGRGTRRLLPRHLRPAEPPSRRTWRCAHALPACTSPDAACVSRYSAAELLDASCDRPKRASAEVDRPERRAAQRTRACSCTATPWRPDEVRRCWRSAWRSDGPAHRVRPGAPPRARTTRSRPSCALDALARVGRFATRIACCCLGGAVSPRTRAPRRCPQRSTSPTPAPDRRWRPG